MSKIKNGGPAFPRAGFSGPRGIGIPENGMTLRDYFAAQCIAGLFVRDRNRKLISDARESAQLAYEWADAMIRARVS